MPHMPPARSTVLLYAIEDASISGENVGSRNSSEIPVVDADRISDASAAPSRIGGRPHRSLADLSVHMSVSGDAGPLWKEELCDDNSDLCTIIPHRGRFRKRVLVLCTGGTLTMSNDPTKGNSLAPVQGALTSYLAGMSELTDDPEMPEIISHEYRPLIDSSDMGPGDWAMLARDINANYYYFDGFVILMGTDTVSSFDVPRVVLYPR